MSVNDQLDLLGGAPEAPKGAVSTGTPQKSIALVIRRRIAALRDFERLAELGQPTPPGWAEELEFLERYCQRRDRAA